MPTIHVWNIYTKYLYRIFWKIYIFKKCEKWSMFYTCSLNSILFCFVYQPLMGYLIKCLFEVKIQTINCPSFINNFVHLSNTKSSWSTVDLPFRKVNCLLLKQFLFSMCSIILFLIIGLTVECWPLSHGLFNIPFMILHVTVKAVTAGINIWEKYS